MKTKKTAPKKQAAKKSKPQNELGPKLTSKKKDTRKLYGRNAEGLAVDEVPSKPSSKKTARAKAAASQPEQNEAVLRLEALKQRDSMDTPEASGTGATPVMSGGVNWIPLGPLAVPNGQTYGGARVIISGRVTDIVPHPTNGNILYLGTSRGGVWKSIDAGVNWTPTTDNADSLAIGALALAKSNPDILYAGTGEGNVQYYSTVYPTSSAPGIFLGVGILKSIDGGSSWTTQASALFANHSFYRIAVAPNDATGNLAFAATSRGLCRTTNGSTWTGITGGGLPVISGSIIACTDVLIDASDATGHTVYAAFWGSGIYRSTNAHVASPTWTLMTGMPAGNTMSRISLAQSPSNPAVKYALAASSGDSFLGVYINTNTTSWTLAINNPIISVYGAFTSDINVDTTTPDVVYVSGVEFYKCVKSGGVWTVTNIGANIHPDSHCAAIHPTNNSIIYSGNDGGIFKSSNAGATWDDTINEGLCLLQYEAIDNHPTSDAIVLGGTQDNGTEQYRNHAVHYHAADGDGGYCIISKVNGNNVIHSYYGNNFERSTAAGKFGTWSNISAGINGGGLFYPPAAISPTSERIAVGTNVINIDNTMGTSGWPGNGVTLPGISGVVSAVSFASDTIIYAATTQGKVYRLDLSGTTWTARALHANPLPTGRWIWDIAALPGNPNQVIVLFSTFGINHVWQGLVPPSGTATWTSISGTGTGALPDIPMYALAFETAAKFYVGTDVGVFRTINGGATWTNFNQGLPNTAVYDLRYQASQNLLRAGTHGRGLWEIRTDLNSAPNSDLFVRDHAMHTGRYPSGISVPAGYEDPLQYVALNDNLHFWQCADIKVDSPPSYQFPPSDVDYLVFESKLQHQNPEKGNMNQVYVQVHNRGPLPVNNVTVKIMVASAAAGLPDLPANFWSTWPNSPGDANWTPIGTPQVVPVLNPLKPEIVNWQWTPPNSADTHTCMLVVIDSPGDPIPAVNKVFNIGQLVTQEKRVGLKNLHLVNLIPGVVLGAGLNFHSFKGNRKPFNISIENILDKNISIGMILPAKLSKILTRDGAVSGAKPTKLAEKSIAQLKEQFLRKEFRSEKFYSDFLKTYDLSNVFMFDGKTRTIDFSAEISPDEKLGIFFVLKATAESKTRNKFVVTQKNEKGEIIGGSTFIVNSTGR